MEKPLRKLGPYTLVSRIGVGGFGVVWLAEKRTAIATTQFALKLSRDEDIDLEAFKDEAAIWVQASGHPNVLPMIDADIYDEQVVIVSEYVPDGSLAGWLKQHGGKAPSAEAACEIMDGVLGGLAHLHARRIIHRDLKPENILMQRGTPRLADFGIARVLKSSSHSANVSGTLAYMAPEAFDGKRNEHTDAWSVGVIFYQLLAGGLPYDQPDIPSFIGAIMRHDPPPLPDSVPEVLRRIVSKALQRDPANRYASVAEMRIDLREAEHQVWLGGRKTVVEPEEAMISVSSQQTAIPHPIEPEPVDSQSVPTLQAMHPPGYGKMEPDVLPVKPTLPYETWRLPGPGQKRSRSLGWLFGGGVVLVILLLAGVSLTGVYYWKSSRLVNKPQTENPSVVGKSTQTTTPSVTKQSSGPYALQQTLTGHTDQITSVSFSPNGQTVASAGNDRTVKVWNVQDGVLQLTLPIPADVFAVAFSPDGKTLAIGSFYGTQLSDLQTGELRATFRIHSSDSLALSPDGKTLAIGSKDDNIELYDVQTKTVKQTLRNVGDAKSVVFSPDGTTLASSAYTRIILWDPTTGARKQTLIGHRQEVNDLAFSPDGKTLASASHDNTVKLWDAQTGALKQTLRHDSFALCVTFSFDGTMLLSGSYEGTIILWDAQTAALKQTLTGHNRAVYDVGFSPDGKTLASGSLDKTVKLWRGE